MSPALGNCGCDTHSDFHRFANLQVPSPNPQVGKPRDFVTMLGSQTAALQQGCRVSNVCLDWRHRSERLHFLFSGARLHDIAIHSGCHSASMPDKGREVFPAIPSTVWRFGSLFGRFYGAGIVPHPAIVPETEPGPVSNALIRRRSLVLRCGRSIFSPWAPAPSQTLPRLSKIHEVRVLHL